VLESSARPKLELDESKAAAFRANVFSLLQWSLPFFFYKENTKQNVIFIMWDHMLHILAQNNKRVHNMHFTLAAFVSIIYWNFPSVYESNFIRKKTNLFTAWNWYPLIDFHCCLTNCHPFFFPGNERIQMRKLIRILLYIDTYKVVLRHRSKPKL